MILTKTVAMRWNPKNIDWYTNKGYVFTKWKDEFEVKVEDLSLNSIARIKVKCDGENCESPFLSLGYVDYRRYVKEDGKNYCQKCATNLIARAKILETKLKNSISFKQWCIDNIIKEESNKIIARWYSEENNCNPEEVTFRSMGINGKGYWFKCLDHPEHKPELKSICSFTGGHKGSIICNQCKSIATTHAHLVKHLVDKEDGLKYPAGSRKKIPIKCSECGYEKETVIYEWIIHGFSCPRCSDGIPYTEKFFYSFLEQLLNKDFISQLNVMTLKWCKLFRYDFYIERFNIIIETHGTQHYEEVKKWGGLKNVQENDLIKKLLAKENGIDNDNYIVLDCRKSDMEWIKNSIMSSVLPLVLDFNKDDIDWLKCHKAGCGSLVKKVCNLWKYKSMNILGIKKEIEMGISTIRKYLKQGAKLGWCNYDAEVEKRKKDHVNKKVVCLTTSEVFSSQTEASKKYKCNTSTISSCCIGRINYKSAGKHPITGEKLKWMYYDEYIKLIK